MKKILMLVALVLGVSAMAEDATNTANTGVTTTIKKEAKKVEEKMSDVKEDVKKEAKKAGEKLENAKNKVCLLYTSDAADD